MTDQALAYLDRRGPAAESEAPLFFYLSFDAPHPGFIVPPGFEDRYDPADIPDRPLADDIDAVYDHAFISLEPMQELKEIWKHKTPEQRRMATLRYYALCTYADQQFGRALDRLESLGYLDDALIVFTSDHGEMLGDRHHRFCKMGLYEGSIRVPLILAGSAIPESARGTVDARPAELVDLLPTLLSAAGVPQVPELAGVDLLGRDRRPGSFAEYHGEGYEPQQMGPAYMYRTPRWKLILALPTLAADAPFSFDKAHGELYDLQADPLEIDNRYPNPEDREVREAMTRDLLLHVMASIGRHPYRPSHQPLQ